MSNQKYLALEVINGTNLPVPSERTPAGLFIVVSTPYGRWNTAIKTVMADQSIPWNETLIVQAHSLIFPRWLMPIPRKSKAIHFEIRASFEHACLGQGVLLGTVQTTLEHLLLHAGEEFEVSLPVNTTYGPSVLVKAQQIKAPQVVGRAASSNIQFSRSRSKIHRITDAAHEAHTLYQKSNNPNHLHRAIQGFQAVLDQCPDGHSHRGAAISNLAHALLCGFTKGVRTDIDHVISLFRSALTHHPKEHPDHPLSILDLCKALHKRHSHRQDRADLEEAANLYRSLLPMCLEGSHLHLYTIEQCNTLPRDSSDGIITLRRTVVEYCPPRHLHRARSLARLAGDLHARFRERGDINDIHEAINLSREALVVCPANERSFFLSVLSSYTLERFHHGGDSRDIDECISLTREELTLRPLREQARQASLNQLASALESRYAHKLEITDLKEAKQLRQDAHDLFSGNSKTLLPPREHSEEFFDLGRGESTCTRELEGGQQQSRSKPLSDDGTRVAPPRARNVVIFGESGAGKSSVINALAQNQVAATSSSAAGCTFRYQKHEVELPGERFVLFDTVGLDEGTAGTVPAAEAEANLRSLLRELMSPGSNGIGLLVYCVRSVRVSRALLRNYNLFYSAICRKKVPIVVVVTGLENQEPDMESWWYANGREFKRCGMHFDDHACVTTLRKHPGIPAVFTQRITESCENLRTLILHNCSEWVADTSWLALSFADVRNMISGRWNGETSLPPTLIIYDPSQKEEKTAHGTHGDVETRSTHIGGVKYQVHRVSEPMSNSQTSSIEADLLIFYARVDDQYAARQRFATFCAAYRGNMVPVIVVVKGLDNNKAAREWVERHLMHNGGAHPFSTFAPAGDLNDPHAEQELHELIQQSCLVRSERKGVGTYKRFVQILGK